MHVGGTNGKGSTMSFIRYILNSAGLKTHVYTSPHLIEFNERVVIAGNRISDKYLYEVLEVCREASADIPVTFLRVQLQQYYLHFQKLRQILSY